MNPIKEYFSTHPTQLRLFKYGVVALTPPLSVLATEYLASTDWTLKATLIAAISALNIYVATLNPEKEWEGIGAKKRK